MFPIPHNEPTTINEIAIMAMMLLFKSFTNLEFTFNNILIDEYDLKN